MWLFKPKTEVREGAYSDAIVREILQQAGANTNLDWRSTGGAVGSASLVARSMAAASVEDVPTTRTGLDSETLHEIGYRFIMDGESVWLIEVSQDAMVTLTQAADWDVYGPAGESNWTYRLTISGPTSNREIRVGSEQVLHPRLNVEPSRPHVGRSPIALAGETARLAAGVETQFANESGQPSGTLIPAPLDAIQGEALTDLKGDLKQLKGRYAVVPSMAANWGEGRGGSPSDWRLERLGFNPPESTVKIRRELYQEILAAAGIPADMFIVGNQTAKREALRQFLHSTLQPMADVLAKECTRKLAVTIKFGFDKLFASDLQGRARAFQSLVAGGMEIERAASLSGMIVED